MEEDGEKTEAGALEAAAEGGRRGWAVGAPDLPPGEVGPSPAPLLYIQHV